MTVYSPAPAAAKVAAKLIKSAHTHLVGAELRVVFRDAHQTTKGKAVMATTRLITGREAWLAAGMPEDGEEPERFFWIEVAEDIWRLLDDAGREALMDHELCHCRLEPDADGILQMKVAAHDLEEFIGVVRRHGLWRPEVEALVKAGIGEQLRLGDGEDDS